MIPKSLSWCRISLSSLFLSSSVHRLKELKSTMYQAIDNNDLICHLLTRHMMWINNFYIYFFLPLLGKSIKSKFSFSTQFWNGIMVWILICNKIHIVIDIKRYTRLMCFYSNTWRSAWEKRKEKKKMCFNLICSSTDISVDMVWERSERARQVMHTDHISIGSMTNH